MRYFLLLFIVMPVAEMWLLIQVGGLIGAWPTIGAVLLTAVIGLALLRRQGFDTLMRGRAKLASGEVPVMEMLEAILLAVSGALLLTPGFFTDTLGFIGLLPMSRKFLTSYLVNRINIVGGYSQTGDALAGNIYRGSPGSPGSQARREKEAIEGEFRIED